jgi:hypothetical protein
MHSKIYLAGMAMVASLLIMWAIGCASPPVKQPEPTSHMRSTVGTPDELSPLAPVGATNVKRVGNQWTCEQNGRVMIYNEPASCWQPQQK